jgi:hypothetical protein
MVHTPEFAKRREALSADSGVGTLRAHVTAMSFNVLKRERQYAKNT